MGQRGRRSLPALLYGSLREARSVRPLATDRRGMVVSGGILDGVNGREYDSVWKRWKLGSLGLFAVFVVALDAARTLRRIAAR